MATQESANLMSRSIIQSAEATSKCTSWVIQKNQIKDDMLKRAAPRKIKEFHRIQGMHCFFKGMTLNGRVCAAVKIQSPMK